MDNRLKLTSPILFLKTLYIDVYKTDYVSTNINTVSFTKAEKIQTIKTILLNLLVIIFNGITAPIFYTIWYVFRKSITDKIYKGTSWEEILNLMNESKTTEAKSKLQVNGKFLYFLWTYSDAEDPILTGGLPISFGTPNFWNRFKYSAIRNSRANYGYIEFRTGKITEAQTIIDTRNFKIMHKSVGLGDSPDGIYFKWMRDENSKTYFIYENNNSETLFYIGYTGLLTSDVGNFGGRFETGYRNVDNSYSLN